MDGASGWIRVLMRLNPLTYGVEALRSLLYPGAETSISAAPRDGDAASVFAGHVWVGVSDGESPQHEAAA